MRVLVFFVVFAGILCIGREARAEPSVGWHSPETGETLPANAAVLFHGNGLDPTLLQVEVDGVAAELAYAGLHGDPATDPEYQQTRGYVVEPEPAPGATVTVEGFACEEATEECAVSFSYVATEPDVVPPPTPVALEFDVFDVSGASVEPDPSGKPPLFVAPLHYFISLTPGDTSSESFAVYEVEGIHRGGEVGWHAQFESSRHVADRYSDPPFEGPDDICWRARMRDRAGNLSEGYVEACLPCYYRIATRDYVVTDPPEAPDWTDADIFDGGVCAAAAAPRRPEAGARPATRRPASPRPTTTPRTAPAARRPRHHRGRALTATATRATTA